MRQTIAEILEGLGRRLPYSFAAGGNDRKVRLYAGAETLRWTDEYVRKQRTRVEW